MRGAVLHRRCHRDMPVRILQSYSRVSVVQAARWSDFLVQNYTCYAINRLQRFLPPATRERCQSRFLQESLYLYNDAELA